jgi:hypothetical protein
MEQTQETEMDRKMYQPTESQEKRWAQFPAVDIPSDEEFKVRWAKAHHGKVTGWGMGKRDAVLSQMKNSREYQMGIWQGRVDRVRGLDYSEERNENTYNLGYHRGYTGFDSLDVETRRRVEEEYGNE